jgi:hypothetical protein
MIYHDLPWKTPNFIQIPQHFPSPKSPRRRSAQGHAHARRDRYQGLTGATACDGSSPMASSGVCSWVKSMVIMDNNNLFMDNNNMLGIFTYIWDYEHH